MLFPKSISLLTDIDDGFILHACVGGHGLNGKRPMTVKPILKQSGELNPTDFVEYPVWVSVHSIDFDEPWYDETDEETFRPWTGDLPVAPEDGMFLVRAKLIPADGRVLHGFVTPQSASEVISLGTIQPQIFLPSGTICSFWDGMFKRDAEARNILYAELGEEPGAIFPIVFAAELGLATGHVSGSIPGFCWCPKDKVEVYH
jgi:hypothetical protein